MDNSTSADPVTPSIAGANTSRTFGGKTASTADMDKDGEDNAIRKSSDSDSITPVNGTGEDALP